MWNEIPAFVIPGTPSPASLNPTERLVNASREYSDSELDTILAESDALDADGDVLAGAQDTLGDPALEDMSAEERREENLKKSIVAVPNAITVNLLADGVVVGTMQITKEDGWTGYFRDYLRYDENDGHQIVYTVEEVPVPGYKTEYINKLISGRVINAIVNRSVIDINIQKKWEGKIQGPVNVTLYRKFKTVEFDWSFYKNITTNHEEEVATVELNEANSWKHVFTGLQKYNNGGSEVAYTVKEVGETASVIELDGKKFDVEYTGNTTDGFTVTNKKPIDPPTPTPTPTPTPKTSDNSHMLSYALLTLLSAIFVVIVASKRIKYSN